MKRRTTGILAAALKIVPGAYLAEAGAPGAPSSLFLRGAGSNQTLVLVDGVQVNDPTIGGQYNFYDLDLLNVERVEVLRGAASTLYGSDALGGVVNVVTRRGRGDPGFRVETEAGSYGHYHVAFSGEGATGDLDYSFGAGRDRWRNELPDQEFHSDGFSVSLGLDVAAGTRVELRTRHVDSSARDPWDFPLGEQIEADPNIERHRRTSLAALRLRQALGERIDLDLTASWFDVRSRFTNGPDVAGDPAELMSRSDAEVRTGTLTATWSPDLPVDEVSVRLLGGLEYEDEISESFSESPWGAGPEIDDTIRNRAGFFLLEVEALDRVVASGGVRRDRNSFFGGETTASASLLVSVPETATRFRANYGEAFRAPKPVEFSDPWVGNPDLTPEKAVSFDVGIEERLLDGDLVLGATAFRVRGRDFIAYDFETYRLENFSRVRVRGVELNASVVPAEGFLFRGFVTLQDPVKESAGPGEEERLPGRAKRFGGADLSWSEGDLSLGLSVIASDDYPGASRITPDGAHRDHPGRKLLVGLRAAYEVAPGARVFARIENLLDREWYDSENGPNGLPRGFYVGFRLDF